MWKNPMREIETKRYSWPIILSAFMELRAFFLFGKDWNHLFHISPNNQHSFKQMLAIIINCNSIGLVGKFFSFV